MNELMTDKIKMNHVELCELINKLRKEEGGRKEIDKSDLLKKIRKEVKTMESLGLDTEGNFSVSEYKDKSGKSNPTYLMNRDGILQMASSESVYVRAKIIEYINALENKIKEQEIKLSKRDEAILSVMNASSDLERVGALKEFENVITKPLLEKIEEDAPKVAFTDRVLKSKDNMLVRQVAKIASDEGYLIGERKLYDKLRIWGLHMQKLY